MKAVLINDTSAWYHYGCFFTSTGLKRLINESYELIDSIPIQEMPSLKLERRAADCLTTSGLTQFVEQNRAFFARLERASLIILNGEGSIHGDRPGVWRLFSILCAAKQVLNKSVFVVNHSVYPDDGQSYDGASTDQLYRQTYECLDYVAARDQLSWAILRDLGISAVESFDCAVIALDERTFHKERRVAVGGSPIYAPGNLAEFLEVFRRMSQEGWECSFLFGAPDRPAGDDKRFISDMAALDGGLNVRRIADADDFVSEIGRSSLLVSGRFHYTIVSHCLGTPCVVLRANTPKNEALCVALGYPAPIAWDAPDLSTTVARRAAAALERNARSEPSLDHLRSLARRNVP
jgi:polysaccharide pyruvyl transferase WcaK-like protein